MQTPGGDSVSCRAKQHPRSHRLRSGAQRAPLSAADQSPTHHELDRGVHLARDESNGGMVAGPDPEDLVDEALPDALHTASNTSWHSHQ